MPATLVMTDELRVLIVAGLFFIYYLLLKFIPFIAASTIIVCAVLLLMKETKILHYVIAIAFVIVVFLVFKYVLYVKLP